MKALVELSDYLELFDDYMEQFRRKCSSDEKSIME